MSTEGFGVKQPSRRLVRLALPILAALLGCCGLPLYFINHLRMQDGRNCCIPTTNRGYMITGGG